MVERGEDFIEGVARAFEARNYLVILVAIFTSIATWLIKDAFSLYWGILFGSVAAVIFIYIALKLMEGKRILDIADVGAGTVRFEDANLFVDDIHIMNLGSKEAQQIIEKKGMGVIIKPHNSDSIPVLANAGQRQAIVHVASRLMGIHRDVDSPEFTPLARRDLDNGNIAIYLVPTHGTIEDLINAVERAPLLESAVSKPTSLV